MSSDSSSYTSQVLTAFYVGVNPELHEAVPVLLSAARNLTFIMFLTNPDKRSGTTWDSSGIAVKHKSNRAEYWITFQDDKSLTKFVEIVTAPKSKSQLEVLNFGEYKENQDTVSLSYQLTHMAASRGHKLMVQPLCLNTRYSELLSSSMEQQLKACRMPSSLLFGKK